MSSITITITSLSSQRTDSIEVSPSTTLLELCQYATALLDLPNGDTIILTKDGKRIYKHETQQSDGNTNQNPTEGMTLSSVGIQNGDLIVVLQTDNKSSTGSTGSTASAASSMPMSSTAAASGGGGGGGGLDFSSLLATMNAPSTSTSTATATANTTSSSSTNSGGGGLQFNLPMLSGSLFAQQMTQTTPVQWDGMTLDDAMSRNKNPDCFVKVLLDEQQHGNLLKELNYHNPVLARKLKAAGLQNAASVWRQEMQRSTLTSTMTKTMESQKEIQMEKRLQSNPMDAEANAYFGEKIQKKNVDDQYRQMMEEFPESMGRVLMLYINAKVNNHPIHAFVDSDAQSTIMSSKCAEKCGLLHLLDERFHGQAVGVGTGKILGRIHIAQMQIADHYFPCTITVMDSEEGLGDKNMDFLLGLDMLKRHRCNIDLSRNALVFRVGEGTLEASFLHEKDLDETKGGTRGFDAKKNNEELEKMNEDE